MVFISAKTDTRTGFNIPLNEVYANSIVNVLISPWKQQKYIFLGHNGEKTYSTCQCISLEKCRFDEIRGCCCLFKFQMRKSNVFNGIWCAKLTWRVNNINSIQPKCKIDLASWYHYSTTSNFLDIFHHGDGIAFMSHQHRDQRFRYKQWYFFTIIR